MPRGWWREDAINKRYIHVPELIRIQRLISQHNENFPPPERQPRKPPPTFNEQGKKIRRPRTKQKRREQEYYKNEKVEGNTNQKGKPHRNVKAKVEVYPIKNFTVVPQYSHFRKCIRLDTQGYCKFVCNLQGALMKFNYRTLTPVGNERLKNQFWSTYLNMNKVNRLTSRSWKFDYFIVTDGVNASVQFIEANPPPSNEESDNDHSAEEKKPRKRKQRKRSNHSTDSGIDGNNNYYDQRNKQPSTSRDAQLRYSKPRQSKKSSNAKNNSSLKTTNDQSSNLNNSF